jgi:RimJ/RimL family protein N-acetyltransferase
VPAFDPTPYAGLEDRLRAGGITIATLRDLAADPNRDRKLYDLEWELQQDVPAAEDLTRADFEKWLEVTIQAPMCLPNGYLVAVEGDKYVGMSNLWGDRASDMLYTGLTGVKRSHRRRGIATALKVRAIAFARANGNPIIKTNNEINNRPMLSINERLGFVPQPAWIQFEKRLRDDHT